MDPNAVTPELALRAYEAMTYYASWAFTVVACVAMLAYALFVLWECYVLPGSARRKPKIQRDDGLETLVQGKPGSLRLLRGELVGNLGPADNR